MQNHDQNRWLGLFITAMLLVSSRAHAGEDIGTTGKNTASDLSTAAKKSGRWGSRQARKVVGKDTKAKDEEDRRKNKRDDEANEAKKEKNRAREESR